MKTDQLQAPHSPAFGPHQQPQQRSHTQVLTKARTTEGSLHEVLLTLRSPSEAIHSLFDHRMVGLSDEAPYAPIAIRCLNTLVILRGECSQTPQQRPRDTQCAYCIDKGRSSEAPQKPLEARVEVHDAGRRLFQAPCASTPLHHDQQQDAPHNMFVHHFTSSVHATSRVCSRAVWSHSPPMHGLLTMRFPVATH